MPGTSAADARSSRTKDTGVWLVTLPVVRSTGSISTRQRWNASAAIRGRRLRRRTRCSHCEASSNSAWDVLGAGGCGTRPAATWTRRRCASGHRSLPASKPAAPPPRQVIDMTANAAIGVVGFLVYSNNAIRTGIRWAK